MLDLIVVVVADALVIVVVKADLVVLVLIVVEAAVDKVPDFLVRVVVVLVEDMNRELTVVLVDTDEVFVASAVLVVTVVVLCDPQFSGLFASTPVYPLPQ